MNRKQAIQIIKETYPADSIFKTTRKKGEELLKQAKEKIKKPWQQESTKLLIIYAELCQDELIRIENKPKNCFYVGE